MVAHLAALIAIPYSYQAPWSYLETNAAGTLNVLEVARSLGTARVIATSTSEVYGTAQRVPMDESHPLHAQSPYSASKIAADKFVESYNLSFDLPTVTLRPFNTYGPRQSARAVIPTVISQLASGKREISLGSVTPTRDFTFVLDTAAAFRASSRRRSNRSSDGPSTPGRATRSRRRPGPTHRRTDGRRDRDPHRRPAQGRRTPKSTDCSRTRPRSVAPLRGSRVTPFAKDFSPPSNGSPIPATWRATSPTSTTSD